MLDFILQEFNPLTLLLQVFFIKETKVLNDYDFLDPRALCPICAKKATELVETWQG
jgi:hypothetical protein